MLGLRKGEDDNNSSVESEARQMEESLNVNESKDQVKIDSTKKETRYNVSDQINYAHNQSSYKRSSKLDRL